MTWMFGVLWWSHKLLIFWLSYFSQAIFSLLFRLGIFYYSIFSYTYSFLYSLHSAFEPTQYVFIYVFLCILYFVVERLIFFLEAICFQCVCLLKHVFQCCFKIFVRLFYQPWHLTFGVYLFFSSQLETYLILVVMSGSQMKTRIFHTIRFYILFKHLVLTYFLWYHCSWEVLLPHDYQMEREAQIPYVACLDTGWKGTVSCSCQMWCSGSTHGLWWRGG